MLVLFASFPVLLCHLFIQDVLTFYHMLGAELVLEIQERDLVPALRVLTVEWGDRRTKKASFSP